MTAGHGTGGSAAEVRPGGPVVLRVDRERCIGSGMCVLTAPDSVSLGPDGIARPLHGADRAAGDTADATDATRATDAGPPAPPAEALTPELADAVDFCPVEALSLHPPYAPGH
ncbi:ferredoxin [Kitasatospora sp. NPDC054939]